VREQCDFQGDQNDEQLWTCHALGASVYGPVPPRNILTKDGGYTISLSKE